MVKILVVCQANMSRSQSLAHYLRAFSEQSRLPVYIQSAGIDKKEIQDIHKGERRRGKGTITPSPKVRALMEEPELLVTGKSPHLTPARAINKRMVEWADIIIAADAGIERWVKLHFPRAKTKVRLSTRYARSSKGTSRVPRMRGEMGMKDAAWPRGKPNPPEYEPGVQRGTPEAHRLMLKQSMGLASATVSRWKEHTPFLTPRQRKKRRKLAARKAR